MKIVSDLLMKIGREQAAGLGRLLGQPVEVEEAGTTFVPAGACSYLTWSATGEAPPVSVLTTDDAVRILNHLLGSDDAVAPFDELHRNALLDAIQQAFDTSLPLLKMGMAQVSKLVTVSDTEPPGARLAAVLKVKIGSVVQGPLAVLLPGASAEAWKQRLVVEARPALPQLVAQPVSSEQNMDMVMDIQMPLVAILGQCALPLKDMLRLKVGSVVELEQLAGDPIQLTVNGKVVGHGEVVLIDDDRLGVRVRDLRVAL